MSKKGFRTDNDLKRHKKNVHDAQQARQDGQQVENDEGGRDDESQLDPRPFKCTVLNCRSAEGFKTSADLNEHKKVVHVEWQARQEAHRGGDEEGNEDDGQQLDPSPIQVPLPNPSPR